MLNAILSRKHGRAPEDLPAGASWGTIFRLSEDFLTASVFERLAYLDGPTLWSILRAASRPEVLPPRRLVKLAGIEFWPQWDAPPGMEERNRVEPDLLLRFEVGDPPEPVAILVESKIRANRQSADQWYAQWLAWLREETRDGRTPPRMVFMAVDGLGPVRREAAVQAFSARVRELAGGEGLPIQATAARWKDLLHAVRRQPRSTDAERHIRTDIEQALGLLGYRDIPSFEEFPAFAATLKTDLPRALDAFGRIQPPLLRAAASLSNFSGLDALRPIRTRPDAFPRLEHPYDP